MINKEEEIVTFETYYNPMLAEIIRTKLEANGISCMIVDASLGALYPVYDQGSGGIKVKVFAHDLQKAREIIGDEPELLSGDDIETNE